MHLKNNKAVIDYSRDALKIIQSQETIDESSLSHAQNSLALGLYERGNILYLQQNVRQAKGDFEEAKNLIERTSSETIMKPLLDAIFATQYNSQS